MPFLNFKTILKDIISPYLQMEKLNSEKLSNLPKITQPVSKNLNPVFSDFMSIGIPEYCYCKKC